MRSVFEESAEVLEILSNIGVRGAELLASLACVEKGRLVPASTQIKGLDKDQLCVLSEGTLLLFVGDQVTFYFEEGDILWPELFDRQSTRYSAEFAVRMDLYQLANDADRMAWSGISMLRVQALLLLLGSQVRGEQQVTPQFKRYEAGAVIIEQGDSGTDVYTLLEGSARAMVGEVEVGSVSENEIFGALAALTGTKRTASVVAESSCLVMSLPKDRFLELIRERPQTVCKLVEDMAKTIIKLNEKVVDMSGSRV